MKKKTTENIIEELKKVYNETLDYSKLNFVGSNKKFCLICPKHGEFWVRYDHIIHNEGCPFCKKEKEIEIKWKEYIQRAKDIHGNKYSYNKNGFKNIMSKIEIVCPIHGSFYQTLNAHINNKQGCEKCYHDSKIGKYKMTTEEFIKRAREVHGDKYDYSQTVYNGLKEKINIICPKHGEFWQVAYDHLRGFKCKKCKYENNTDTTEEFIEKARKIHGDKYDYSKVKYINNHTEVCIICHKKDEFGNEHGEFWIKPSFHLMYMGCHKCNIKRLEKEVENALKENGIQYIWQTNYKTFSWLGKQSLDFYLPDYNIAIECQGEQHFKPKEYFGGEKRFREQIERDTRKKELCIKNNINLLYFTHKKETPYQCINTIDDLIKKIRELK